MTKLKSQKFGVFAIVIGLVGVLVACGPSPKDISTARTATYAAPTTKILDQAIQVAQETYKIGEVDAINHRFTTYPQMYNSEGGRESEGADGYVSTAGGSIQLHFVIELSEVEGGRIAIRITPRTFQRLAWSPKPRELLESDPNIPGWVLGRRDSLSLALYDRMRPWTK